MLFSITPLKLSAFFILLPLSFDLVLANVGSQAFLAAAKLHPGLAYLMNFALSNGTGELSNFSMTATPKISNGDPTTATDPMETCADDGSLFDSSLGGAVVALLIILFWHVVRICCCMSKSNPPPPPPSRAPIPNVTATKSGTSLGSGNVSVRSQSVNIKSTRSVRSLGA
uniref:Uncharacterized protein n=3 Tax=Meloidogyne TaxID=189290 RepID=A0A915LE74_MELJA